MAVLNIEEENNTTVRRNTKDFDTKGDVFVVFEPEQIHILGSKQDIEGSKSFVQQQQTAPLSPDELALGLYSIAYNSGVSEQEFMDRINRDGNLSVFGVGGQVGGQQVFNQVKTASAEIDLNLSNKIQKMLAIVTGKQIGRAHV